MADEGGEAGLHQSGAATPKGKLESLSKEDLVKFVKRQTILLQKSKTRNSELEAQISALEKAKLNETDDSKSTDGLTEPGNLSEELQQLRQERDELVQAYQSVQTSQEKAREQIEILENECLSLKQEKKAVLDNCGLLEKEKKTFLEEIECLKMKDETLTSTFHCLEQERATLAENNKRLITEKSDLQIKLEDLDEEKLSWRSEKDLLLSQLQSLSLSLQQCEKLELENQELLSKLDVVNSEKNDIQKRLEDLEFSHEQRKEQVQLLQAEIIRIQEQELQDQDVRSRLQEAEEQIRKYEAQLANQSVDVDRTDEVQTLLHQVEELKATIENMQAEYETQQSVLQRQIEQLSLEKKQQCHQSSESELNDGVSSRKDVSSELQEDWAEKDLLKTRIDALNKENERLEEQIASLENQSQNSFCEQQLHHQTYSNEKEEKLNTEVLILTEEKETLLLKISALEQMLVKCEEKDTESLEALRQKSIQVEELSAGLQDARSKLMNYEGSDVSVEKVHSLQQELAMAKTKLSDYEASLGREFSMDVIQNLQQELAETKMKLSELEGSAGMYVVADQNTGQEAGSQNGWSDLPDIEEEPEGDSLQNMQANSAPMVEKRLPENLDLVNEDDKVGQVSVERIEKFIAVSSHVLEDDNLAKDDALEIQKLYARISELEQDNSVLKAKLEQFKEESSSITNEKQEFDGETDTHSEIIASLQAHRQHLEEKLVILGDKHETVTFELAELHAERESLKSEMESLQSQLKEWENMMGMLKEEKDAISQELEEYTNKDASLRKELEFLLSSLNEAITERDSLQDEVFKLSQHDGSTQGNVREMKSMINDIISERNNLLTELDAVISSRNKAKLVIEELQQELEKVKREKEDIDREKESLVVRFHLAEDKGECLNDSYEAQLKISSEMEENLQTMKQQTQSYQSQIEALKQDLENATQQLKGAEDTAAERKTYSLDLENQILDLSNSLTEYKQKYSLLVEQLNEKQANADDVEVYHQQIISLQLQQTETKQSLNQLTADVAKLTEEKLDAEQKAEDILQDCEHLKESLQLAEKDNQEMNKLLLDLKDVNATLKNEAGQLQNEVMTLTFEKSELEKTISLFQAQIHELEAKHKLLHEELSLKSHLLSLQVEDVEKHTLSENELNSLLAETKQKLEEVSRERDHFKSTLEELRNQLASQGEDVQKHKLSEDELNSLLAETRQKLEEVSRERDHFKLTLEELRNELSSQGEDVQNHKLNEDELNSLLAETRQKLEEVSRERDHFKSTLEEISNDLALQGEDIQKYKLNEKELESLLTQANQKVEEVLEEKEHLMTELLKLKEELSLQMQDVENCKLSENELNNLLAETKQKLEEVSLERDNLVTALEEIKNNTIALENEKEIFLKQNKEWGLKVEAFHLRINERQKDSEVLRKKVDAVEKNLSELIDTNQISEDVGSDLRRQLQHKQEQIIQIKEDIEAATLDLETPVETTWEHSSNLDQAVQKCNELFRQFEAEKRRCDEIERSILAIQQTFQDQSSSTTSQHRETQLSVAKDVVSKMLLAQQGRLGQVEEELRLKESDLSELTSEVNVLKEENNMYCLKLQELENCLSTAAEAARGKEEERQKLGKENSRLESCVQEKEVEIEQCRRLLAASEDRQRSLIEENLKAVQDLEYNLKETSVQNDSLREQLSKIDNVVNLLQKKIENLEQELDKTQKDKVDLASQLNDWRAEKDINLNRNEQDKEIIQDLSEQLAKWREHAEELALQLEKLQLESNQMSSKLEEAETKAEALQRCVDDAWVDREALLERLEATTRERNKLELEMRALSVDKEALLDKLQGYEGQVESLKALMNELSVSLNDSKSENVELKLVQQSPSAANISKSAHEESCEVDLLRKQLKEKDEVNAKLKQLAIKTKKELSEKQAKLEAATKQIVQLTKSQDAMEADKETWSRQSGDSADKLSQQLKKLQENYKQVQASLDSTLDEAEQDKMALKTAQKDIEQLIGQLNTVKGQSATTKEEKEQLQKQVDLLRAEVKSKEGSVEELRTKLRATDTEMAAIRIQMEEFNRDRQKVEQKLTESELRVKQGEEEHRAQIQKLEGSLREAQDQLMAARQSVKQNSMLDLEIADYERTIANLHLQVAEKEKRVEELKAEMDKQEQTISLMQTQIDTLEEHRSQAEDRANKLKNMLMKTKKDLADARKLESAQRSSDAHLRGQLESTSQQVEEFKVQISQLMADNQRLQEKIRLLNETNQRTTRSLESQVETLTSQLETTRSELKTVEAEYNSYKVRAHSVLRQQKSKSSPEENTDVDKFEKERYENAIDLLKMKLQEAQDQMLTARKDMEHLQEEHDHLAQRHSKLISDLEERETNFRLRLENFSKEKSEALADMQEKITSLELLKSVQAQKFKEQINKLKDDNMEMVELLQKQLDVSEMDNIRLQREIQQLQRSSRRDESGEHTSPSEFYPITAHPVEERQEGEGSEIVDQEPLKGTRAQPQPAFTFEQLITTPLEELPGMKAATPSVDEASLQAELSASQKKIEHLTELLNESEEGVSRLTEQARILKEEIRRLERNVERERETQNMEYLKNIFLQFVCPKVGEQRQQLVPVLTTMLKLSPEEKARIQAVALGDEQAGPGQGAVGWGSYLHRWSGLT